MPGLSWNEENVERSVACVYERMEQQAVEVVDWYLAEKTSKARSSKVLRLTALLLATCGGLVPLLHAAGLHALGVEWGYVLLASAAGSVGIDRFFGFSSAWMRYMTTALALQRLLGEVQLDWLLLEARRVESPPRGEDIEERLELLKRFRLAVASQVEHETLSWAMEFQGNLAQLESHAVGRSGVPHNSDGRRP
jgi:hypothetical protein